MSPDQALPAFADARSAQFALSRLAKHPPFEETRPALLRALAAAADPNRSLVNFERFAENYGADLYEVLRQNPRVVEILVTLFSASQFLTEILLRNPESLRLLLDRQSLTLRKTIEQIQTEAEEAANLRDPSPESASLLRRYQKTELLRIGASDFLGLYDLRAVISQISRTAIALTRASLHLAAKQTGINPEGFVVLAMGKLGGRELNYSSDIDLLFLSADNQRNYTPLAQKLIEILAAPTPEGFLYRVDMRLRPWGKDGPLVPTLEGYQKYVEKNARLWEKQALLKIRPIAGDLALGETLRERIQPLILNTPPEELRAGVFAMKTRTEEYLREKGRAWGEVKLGAGSIRDVEFVVQYLQLANLRHNPHLRTRATLKALPRLRAAGLLTASETRILTDGYIFLRTIEHYLQMMDYRQTYTLPTEPRAIALLARRLGFPDGETFIARYQEHCLAIRAIFLRQVGSQPAPQEPQPVLRQHLARLDVSYTATFNPSQIEQHAALANRLSEKTPLLLEALPQQDEAWQITIIAHDYPGELSIICGLFFVYGLNIIDGNIFTYEPEEVAPAPPPSRSSSRRFAAKTAAPAASRQKIIDVFTVKPAQPGSAPTPETWQTYAADLENLLARFRAGERREARGQLAKRVGAACGVTPPGAGAIPPLLPVEIEIDNSLSERYTALRIDAPDTLGFLYEFTNALAFTRTNIHRMVIRSVGSRAQDILFVTDTEGRKISDPQKQRELRAAILLIKHFTHLLPYSPNPEAALLHFREFVLQLFLRPRWVDEIASLESPEVLKDLAQGMGISDFLWDDFLRMQYANLFPVVRDIQSLAAPRPRAQLQAELQEALHNLNLGGIDYPDWRSALNAFKDRELFRIDMRHILGRTLEFWDFSAELTDLAEIVVCAALENAQRELNQQYGEEGGVSVLALGKCGGRELGFASDIELMFVYSGEGFRAASYYEKLVNAVIGAIQARQEGIFQVDLQLRPYGKAGSLAVTLESFRKYYAPQGPAWAYERQALVKLRPIAGDEALGAALEALRDSYTYSGGFDVTAMRAMRERQVRHLVAGGTFNAKYSPGGLVDVEYLIQALQINAGKQDPSLRVTNIRDAMTALHKAGILSEEDYNRLRKAHTFLRWLIDSLRVVRGNAKDITVPAYGSEEFSFLARRLRYGDDTARLREELLRYQSEVQEINLRLLGA